MRTSIPIVTAAVLTACGSAAITNNAADAEQGSRRGAAGDAWAGHYEGRTDGGDGFLDIAASRQAGSYSVRMEVAGPGCGGDAAGTGRLVNGRLIVNAPTQSGEQCTLEFTRNGAGLRSTESGSCYQQHGPSCDFTGTLRRTGAARSSVVPGAPEVGGRTSSQNAASGYAELVAATENGGAPGCFDPSLRGRERAVAERLGAQPCEGSSTPAPSPRGGPWIVGAWAIDPSECRVVATFTFNRDGSFNTDGDAGTWRLSGSTLTMISTESTGAEGWQGSSPTRYDFQVTQAGRGMRMRNRQGTVSELSRCPNR